jgi:sugar phosphate isomerase/epimerase
MAQADRLEFGVDLVTFFNPQFWGVGTHAEIKSLAKADPGAFWGKMLDGVAASGVTGVELTFSPFNWQDAVAHFGSFQGFAAQLTNRGLKLASGFFADMDTNIDLADKASHQRFIDSAKAYAEFIAACGADIMVSGAPMRKTRGTLPGAFIDLDYAGRLGDILNRVGEATFAQGVRLALHTEGHSVFAAARDIDLMMLATDPAYVHMCPDTAHILISGGDPLQVIDRHHERMIIAHWKDALGRMTDDIVIDHDIHSKHREYWCGFGLGRVDWPGFMRLLQKRQFAGWAILELDAAPDPIGDIKRGLGFVRTALLPILG